MRFIVSVLLGTEARPHVYWASTPLLVPCQRLTSVFTKPLPAWRLAFPCLKTSSTCVRATKHGLWSMFRKMLRSEVLCGAQSRWYKCPFSLLLFNLWFRSLQQPSQTRKTEQQDKNKTHSFPPTLVNKKSKTKMVVGLAPSTALVSVCADIQVLSWWRVHVLFSLTIWGLWD